MNNNNSVFVNSNASATTQIIAKQRQVIQSYGRYFGAQIYTIQSSNPDLTYNDDVRLDKNTLRKPIEIFYVRAIDIKSISLVENPLNGQPQIAINREDNDSTLVFPLVEPAFIQASEANVKKCLDNFRKKSTPVFFSTEEYDMLVKHVNLANKEALRQYEGFAEKMLRLAQTTQQVIDQIERDHAEYRRQCGTADNLVETEITVSVEQQTIE